MFINMQSGHRHKVFVSYHHENDQGTIEIVLKHCSGSIFRHNGFQISSNWRFGFEIER